MNMTKEQYKQKKTELYNEYEKSKRELAKQYAIANNPYKVGQVFKDHIGSIIIEDISTGSMQEVPCCIYFGTILNKDGKPNKAQKKRHAWQFNDVTSPITENKE